jgi:hypothetical protein
MSLGDPSRSMLMMAWERTGTCYVPFWVVVMPSRCDVPPLKARMVSRNPKLCEVP